jgi:hypothetical protein
MSNPFRPSKDQLLQAQDAVTANQLVDELIQIRTRYQQMGAHTVASVEITKEVHLRSMADTDDYLSRVNAWVNKPGRPSEDQARVAAQAAQLKDLYFETVTAGIAASGKNLAREAATAEVGQYQSFVLPAQPAVPPQPTWGLPFSLRGPLWIIATTCLAGVFLVWFPRFAAPPNAGGPGMLYVVGGVLLVVSSWLVFLLGKRIPEIPEEQFRFGKLLLWLLVGGFWLWISLRGTMAIPLGFGDPFSRTEIDGWAIFQLLFWIGALIAFVIFVAIAASQNNARR